MAGRSEGIRRLSDDNNDSDNRPNRSNTRNLTSRYNSGDGSRNLTSGYNSGDRRGDRSRELTSGGSNSGFSDPLRSRDAFAGMARREDRSPSPIDEYGSEHMTTTYDESFTTAASEGGPWQRTSLSHYDQEYTEPAFPDSDGITPRLATSYMQRWQTDNFASPSSFNDAPSTTSASVYGNSSLTPSEFHGPVDLPLGSQGSVDLPLGSQGSVDLPLGSQRSVDLPLGSQRSVDLPLGSRGSGYRPISEGIQPYAMPLANDNPDHFGSYTGPEYTGPINYDAAHGRSSFEDEQFLHTTDNYVNQVHTRPTDLTENRAERIVTFENNLEQSGRYNRGEVVNIINEMYARLQAFPNGERDSLIERDIRARYLPAEPVRRSDDSQEQRRSDDSQRSRRRQRRERREQD